MVRSGLVLLGAAALVAGCGHGPSLLDDCRGGRSMTVDDPAGDAPADAHPIQQALYARHNPKPFDIREVTIATGGGRLCAAIYFAGGRPQILYGGTETSRHISIELTAPMPLTKGGTPLQTGPLSRLDLAVVEGGNGASWGQANVVDSDGEVPGAHVSGVLRDRLVQISVPLRVLTDVSADTQAGSTPRLDPSSFAWRVVVVPDCAPEQLMLFPSGRRVSFRAGGTLRQRCG